MIVRLEATRPLKLRLTRLIPHLSSSFLTPSTMVRPQSSAAGVLALLSEPEPVLQEHALQALNALVPQFWAEISEQIELM